MATTLSTFYTTYKNLSLSGVASLDYPPAVLDTARIPCKWVDTLGIDEAPLHRGGPGGDRTLRLRLVVVVAPRGQSTHDSRWIDTLAMVDTVNAGIKSVADKTTRWSVTAEPVFADEFFAVVATVEQNEWRRS